MKKLILKILYQDDNFLIKNKNKEYNKFEMETITNKIVIEVDNLDLDYYLSKGFEDSNEFILSIPTNKIFFNLDSKIIKDSLLFESKLKNEINIKIENLETEYLKGLFLSCIILKLDKLLIYFRNNIIYEMSNLNIIFNFILISLYYNNGEILIELYYILNYYIKYPKSFSEKNNNNKENIVGNLNDETITLVSISEEIIFRYSKFKKIFKELYEKYVKELYFSVSENFEISYSNKVKENNKIYFELLNYKNEKVFESNKIDKYYRIFKKQSSSSIFSINYLGFIMYSVSGLKYYFYSKFYQFDFFKLITKSHKNDFRIIKFSSKATALTDDARFFQIYIFNNVEPNKYINFETKKPVYNYERGTYEMDLFKQSKHASTKNFELIERNKNLDQEDQDIYFVHCKQDKGKFIIHSRDPFNELLSFFISIVANIKKTLE